MDGLSIKPVVSKQDLQTFIYLPEKIHAAHSNWLPPLYVDEKTYYDPRRNRAFSYCDTQLWLAFRGSRAVGRIMGIIHHPYNAQQGEKTLRFAQFDCYEDAQIAFALLDAVEAWGRERGMEQVVGPFGFSDKDPEGLQVEGFEHLPIMVTACNLPYLPGFLEERGYVKFLDCLDYLIDLSEGTPPLLSRLYARLRERSEWEVMTFSSKRELKPIIVPAFELINRTYTDLYGFVPMDEQEMHEMADRYLPILDPRFVRAVLDKNGVLIAFLLGLPNMTEGIQRARGRLLPWGFVHILKAMRRSRQLDLMLGCIDHAYRHRGLDVLMGCSIIESARAAGMQRIETHLVLETNTAMRAEYEKIGAHLHKRFRIYTRLL